MRAFHASRPPPRRALLLPLLLATGLAGGCAAPLSGDAARSSSYWGERGSDALQAFHVGFGWSKLPGLFAHAHVSCIGFGTAVLMDARYVGNDFGYVQRWREAGAGVVPGIGGVLVRGTDTVHPLDFIDPERIGPSGNAYLTQVYTIVSWPYEDRRTGSAWWSLSRVEGGAHLLFLGVSAGVDVVQTLDLLTGLVGLDLCGDDGIVHHPGPAVDPLHYEWPWGTPDVAEPEVEAIPEGA
jgi:hypothetical protein